MRFGVFYELQLPKPWGEGAERRLVHEAMEQVQLADRLGIDHAWAVEHHFLEEYSHCSASEVFLSALAATTERIRVGFGIRQVIPNYNHPSRTAEAVAMLDLVSNGRVDFGIGEGATRLELHGYGIPAKRKQALSFEAAEQIANMMVMEPYPGYQGEGFSFPCRNVVPKPVQKPHPPMWLACTNRKTIEIAARNGLGALAFTFVDPQEARTWADTYYSIIRSDQCVPLGHSVNANIALVAGFSLHKDPAEARRRGIEGFAFFRYAINALVANDTKPGRTRLWEEYEEIRDRDLPTIAAPGHRDARRVQQVLERVPGRGRRPGDLPAAGRSEPTRLHLRGLGALRLGRAAPIRLRTRGEGGAQGAGARALHREGAGPEAVDETNRRRRDPRRQGDARARGLLSPRMSGRLSARSVRHRSAG